jgi:hypothetical protein
VAYTWPFAVTAEAGKLEGIAPLTSTTMTDFAGTFKLSAEDVAAAIEMALALGIDLDPAILAIAPPAA